MTKLAPNVINEFDPLPKTMCHRCSFKVSEFFEFRSVCIKAQEVLKSKIPWLKHKQFSKVEISNPPMVEVHMNPINSISPNEKLLACGSFNEDGNNPMIIIDDDSPPFKEETCFPDYFGENNTLSKRTGRSKKGRCIWETKKRKKKHQKTCKIAEVFTTDLDECQSLDATENDPLCISSDNNVEEKGNFTFQVKNSDTELSKNKSGTFKNEIKNENVQLPNHILVTNIPRVGLVYTCEKCARTFLSSQPASLHVCDCQENNGDVISREEKKELPLKSVKFYKCNQCSQAFSRQSLLVSHKRTHFELDSSSEETFTPGSQRKKKIKRKRSKSNVSSCTNRFLVNINQQETEVTRHAFLSSDSN